MLKNSIANKIKVSDVFDIPFPFCEDVWDFSRDDFKIFNKKEYSRKQSKFNLGYLENSILREELKYFLYKKLESGKLTETTICGSYLRPESLKLFNNYLKNSDINSFRDIESSELKKYTFYLSLKKPNLSKKSFYDYRSYISTIPLFFKKEEQKDDYWDAREMFKDKVLPHRAEYILNFSEIKMDSLKSAVKDFIRFRLLTVALNTARSNLRMLVDFLNFLYDKKEKTTLNDLDRSEIESYLSYLHDKTNPQSKLRYESPQSIKIFLEYLELKEHKEATKKPVNRLITYGDYGKNTHKVKKTKDKFIPEDILEKIEGIMQYLTPSKYIPVVYILRASGWRISDVLNLKYNNCLLNLNGNYYLNGDISKTNVFDHRIPISDEIVSIIETQIEIAKKNTYNTSNYLFPSETIKGRGRPFASENISKNLNKLIKKHNILDSNGEIFRIKNHAWRHTKAVELINNGMNLVHVQKWLAHQTPIMTLHYAKILDQTMRKSWEEATKDGLFKLDGTGNAAKVDVSNIQDEDIIEWEWIKHNLDAVRMPLGYCMKPNKMECATQLNPCLTCRSLCTTPEFIPAYEQEIFQTKEIINKGKSQNRTFWVEKNEILLNKLQSVLTVLKDGKTNHRAGKQGREYVGEQRKQINT